ncbi:threonylcarbamoyladenosine tRNA methylthiotransferase [Tanacetum coccineum]
MVGQLLAFGYAISDDVEGADLWLINICTVKSPIQSAIDTLISKCKSAKKPLVVAGCVPQGSRDLKELEGVTIVGVQQIVRVIEVVEDTHKGHDVRLLNRKTLSALDLPKVVWVLARIARLSMLGVIFEAIQLTAFICITYGLMKPLMMMSRCNEWPLHLSSGFIGVWRIDALLQRVSIGHRLISKANCVVCYQGYQ